MKDFDPSKSEATQPPPITDRAWPQETAFSQASHYSPSSSVVRFTWHSVLYLFLLSASNSHLNHYWRRVILSSSEWNRPTRHCSTESSPIERRLFSSPFSALFSRVFPAQSADSVWILWEEATDRQADCSVFHCALFSLSSAMSRRLGICWYCSFTSSHPLFNWRYFCISSPPPLLISKVRISQYSLCILSNWRLGFSLFSDTSSQQKQCKFCWAQLLLALLKHYSTTAYQLVNTA